MFSINSPKVISSSVGGEVIVINLDSGCYYSLNKSAASLWEAVIGGVDINDLKADFTAIANSKVSDFDEFINMLTKEELIVLDDDSNKKSFKLNLDDFDEFDLCPVIEKFDDMQELLILDPIHEVGEEGWPYKD